MPVFAIYKYKLKQASHLQLTISTDDEATAKPSPDAYPSLEAFFESFIHDRGSVLDIVEEKKAKNKDEGPTMERHKSEVLQHRDGIVLFRMQANCKRTVHNEDWEKEPVPDHPDIRVIIDNQTDHNLMLVERSSNFDSDKAARIIEQSFNRMMKDYGVTIVLHTLKKEMQFWDAVNEIRNLFKDKVKTMQFAFANKGEEVKDDGSFTLFLMSWASKCSEGGNLMLNIIDSKLSQVKEDLIQMADLCYRSGKYNLVVHFRDFGIYRYGQDLKAQYGLEDDVLDLFIGTQQQLAIFDEDEDKKELSLEEWLHRINILFRDYDEDSSMASKRSKGSRR